MLHIHYLLLFIHKAWKTSFNNTFPNQKSQINRTYRRRSASQKKRGLYRAPPYIFTYITAGKGFLWNSGVRTRGWVLVGLPRRASERKDGISVSGEEKGVDGWGKRATERWERYRSRLAWDGVGGGWLLHGKSTFSRFPSLNSTYSVAPENIPREKCD